MLILSGIENDDLRQQMFITESLVRETHAQTEVESPKRRTLHVQHCVRIQVERWEHVLQTQVECRKHHVQIWVERRDMIWQVLRRIL